MEKLKLKKIDSSNKKVKIIVAIIISIIVIGVGFMVFKTYSTESDNTFANQYVDGLSFENAKIEVEDGVSTFIVEVYNELNDEISLKKIEIYVTNYDDNEYRLVGYIGDKLDVKEAKFIKASIDKELKDIKNIRYVINK